jgi:tetraacyldisaccharide 4'-kinase
LRQPVISVGNLSVGGTGKTPLAAQIAEWLLTRGERPAILSRGYKRRVVTDGVTVVSNGREILSNLDHAGDEPLMLARLVPEAIVCVAEDRHLAGVVAERALAATVHVLDDGFQHLRLHRDFDILVTTPGEIGEGRVLPAGRLREARHAAARAHFVVFIGGDRETARTEAWELGISGFAVARRTLGPVDAGTESGVVAVAAIGSPEQFFTMLRQARLRLHDTISFPDHHQFTADDVARIAGVVTGSGAAAVVTTAKDVVRFEPLAPLPFRLVAAPMRLEIDGWDSLSSSLQQVLARTRAAA